MTQNLTKIDKIDLLAIDDAFAPEMKRALAWIKTYHACHRALAGEVSFEAAELRACEKSTSALMTSRAISASNKILWLNSKAKENFGEGFLSRKYAKGDFTERVALMEDFADLCDRQFIRIALRIR